MIETGCPAPALSKERALLRVARDEDHVKQGANTLSEARISLDDLNGKPGRGPSRRRSMSMFMLCSQSSEVILEIARDLTKDPKQHDTPMGAAALLAELFAIEHDGKKALLIAEEPDPEGRPGHVSIRFAEAIRQAREAIQRIVRGKLIEAFGEVRPVAELRRDRCAQDPVGRIAPVIGDPSSLS